MFRDGLGVDAAKESMMSVKFFPLVVSIDRKSFFIAGHPTVSPTQNLFPLRPTETPGFVTDLLWCNSCRRIVTVPEVALSQNKCPSCQTPVYAETPDPKEHTDG